MANLKTMRIRAAIDAVRLNMEEAEGAGPLPQNALPEPSAGDAAASLRTEIAALEKRRDALHLQIADLEVRAKRLQTECERLTREASAKPRKEATGSAKAPGRAPAAKKAPAPAPSAKDLAGLKKLKDAFAGFDAL